MVAVTGIGFQVVEELSSPVGFVNKKKAEGMGRRERERERERVSTTT